MDRPLVGEPLAVDLLNTRWLAGGELVDLLADPTTAAPWLDGHGLGVSRRLLPAARINLSATRDALAAAVEGNVRALNEVLDHGRVRLQLTEQGPTEGAEVPEAAWRPAWACARDYVVLLQRSPGRLRKCANPSCVLHFLDVSRGGDRRWCSMAVCGNRSKVRRHRIEARRPG